MPADDSLGHLAPLADDLPPELRELAQFLRRRFHMLKTSVRAYALRNNWDPGAVSRFLSGDRIPPQSFVDTLLADAGPQRSPDEVEDERAHALDLRLKALQVRNAKAARSEQITQELASAEQEISLLRAKERALAKALVKAEAEHVALYEKYQRMQASIQAGPLQIAGAPALARLADDQDRAHEEVVRLKREVAIERAARVAAERLRDELQAQLDNADSELVRAGGAAFEVGTYDLQRQLLVALRDRRTRWGGLINLFVVPVVIYGTPLYLGLIYHILTPGQSWLKVMTACGLLVPVWLALAVRKVDRPEDNRKVKHAVRLVVLTAALFFIAALV